MSIGVFMRFRELWELRVGIGIWFVSFGSWVRDLSVRYGR